MTAVQSLGTFQFYFPEADWDGSFNCFEVHRSRFGEAGPYEEITAANTQPATFTIPIKTSYDVDGLQLAVLVNRTDEVTVTFSGTDSSDVIDAFNEAMPSILEAELDTDIVVNAISAGHASTISVTSSDAWTKFHMSDLYFFGKTAYPPLYSGQTTYLFTDPSAEAGWYYKTRYRNRVTGEVSSFSTPTAASTNVAVEFTELIRGEIYLVDPKGNPASSVLVLLDVPYDSSHPDMVPQQLSTYTDANGYASFRLRRGIYATISIAGTCVTRRIQVPSTGDSFDLASVSISVDPDAYQVQVPNVRVGERRSM